MRTLMQLPYWQVWLPVVVGIVSGGLSLVCYRLFFHRLTSTAPLGPPREKKSQEYDPFVQGSPTEQRKAHRRTGNPVEVFLATEGNQNSRWHGWVLDRSVGGLCIAVNEQFEPGSTLRILPVNAPNITPWTDIEVRSCRPSKEGFELGCQFTRQPTWSVLLLFG